MMNLKLSKQSGVMLCFALGLGLCGCANNTPLIKAANSGNAKEVSRLLADGADVNAKNLRGNTPLHVAADQGLKDVAELLIAKGADVNAKNLRGNTPLHDAANQGYKDVAELLYSQGCRCQRQEREWQYSSS
jgi:ankyrin repeat protein